MKILLVEEHPARERLALLFLQKILQQRNHAVRLTDAWALETEFRRFSPHVVVDNISDTAAHYTGKLGMLTPSERNINLLWEQLPRPTGVERYTFDDLLARGLVDGRTAWGQGFKDLLLEVNPAMDASRVEVVGSMKHALVSGISLVPPAEWARIYEIDVSRFEKVVLIAESFPKVEDLKLWTRSLPDDQRNRLRAFSRYAETMREHYRNLVKTVADSRPNWLVILRTHHSRASGYHQELKESSIGPNIAVNTTGDIGPLLSMADFVIASSSGVLVDAYVMGKRAFNATGGGVLAQLGVYTSVAASFAPPVPVESIDADLIESALASPARTSAATDALARLWLGDTSPQVFERLADFVEQIASRPATPKEIPIERRLRNRQLFHRWMRNVARTRGYGARPFNEGDFPYARAATLVLDSGYAAGIGLR